MKAIVQTGYGSPENLKYTDVEKPRPAADEVLVEVHTASVNPDVWHVVMGRPFILRLMGSGLLRPARTIPGSDMAGRVVEVGRNVTRFQPGDAVFGECSLKMQWINGGAYAEYVCAHEAGLARKPENVSFEQAASVPTSGIIALWNLDDGRLISPGARVLVNGAGGGVGMLAVQIAKAFGAEVTGVDRADKLAMIATLGADHVIDYARDHFTGGDELYDLIFDIPGNHPYSRCRRVLAENGQYILIAHDDFGRQGGSWLGSIPRFLGLVARSFFDKRLARQTAQFPSKQDSMALLARLLQEGKVTPVIGRVFPLEQAGKAIQHMVDGDGVGKVVLRVKQ